MSSKDLAIITFYAAAVCGLVALIAPWFVLRISRRSAAATAWVLALASTVLELISNSNFPPDVDNRIDLVFITPLLLMAWLECIGLTILAALQKSKESRPNN